MRITTFKGEKTVGELAARLFGQLAPDRLQAAQDALVRANPGLKTIGGLKPGGVLLVPDLQGTAPVKGRSQEQPTADHVRAVADAATQYQRRLIQAIDIESQDIGDTTALLKSAAIKRLISSFGLDQQAGLVQDALKARTQGVADLKAAIGSMGQIAKDLDRLIVKLG